MRARLLVVALQCVVILVAAGFILGIMGSDKLAPWLRWTLALMFTASGVVLQASVCTHRHVTLQPAVKGSGPDAIMRGGTATDAAAPGTLRSRRTRSPV
jgi:hypothetical protein